MAAGYFPQNRGAAKPWYEANAGARLERDRSIAAQIVPGLEFRIDHARKLAFLEGELVITECGIPTPIAVRIEFPPDYPQTEPKVFDSNERFQKLPGKELSDRHLLEKGRCCLWLPPKSGWSKHNPDALRQFLLEVVVFFDRQMIYDVTGKWPGPAYDHGWKGYREFIEEELGAGSDLARKLIPAIIKRERVGRNDACPCGSGIKYKRCHLWPVERIQKRIGAQQLLWMFGRLDLSQI